MSEQIPGGGEDFDRRRDLSMPQSDLLDALSDFDEKRNGMYGDLTVMIAEPRKAEELSISAYERADETICAFGAYVVAALDDQDQRAATQDIVRLWLQDDNERNRLFMQLFNENDEIIRPLDDDEAHKMVQYILAHADSNEEASAQAKTVYGAMLHNELGAFMRLWDAGRRAGMIAVERCEHDDCGPDNRQVYCAIESADPECGAMIVTDLLDDLLVESGIAQSNNFAYTSEPEGSIFKRNLSRRDCDFGPPVEHRVAIRHEYDRKLHRDSYHIVVGWVIHRAGVTQNPFNTFYTIDMYPQGRVQAIMEHPSLEYDGEFESRVMTEYDYGALFDELAIIQRSHQEAKRNRG